MSEPKPAKAQLSSDLEVGKVTAFITRETVSGRELLVFEHPTAGVQFPAGTVELGESPEAAVLREVAEETGLTAVSIVEAFEPFAQPLAPDERLISRRCILQFAPGDDGTLIQGVILNRGLAVHVIDSEDNYDRVTYPQYTMMDDGLHVASSKTGWLPRHSLTANVRRYLFHLLPTEPTPDRWTIEADGHTFSLFWVALAQDRDFGLVEAQRQWLDRVRDRL